MEDGTTRGVDNDVSIILTIVKTIKFNIDLLSKKEI